MPVRFGRHALNFTFHWLRPADMGSGLRTLHEASLRARHPWLAVLPVRFGRHVYPELVEGPSTSHPAGFFARDEELTTQWSASLMARCKAA